MNNELKENSSVINSIMRGAEDKIHSLTGLNVTLQVKLNETFIGDDETISKSLKLFATCWNVDPDDLYEKTRKRNTVMMRQILFHYIHYKYPNIYYSTIARHFGIDHTTVMYGIDCVKNYMAMGDDLFNSFYNLIKQFYE